MTASRLALRASLVTTCVAVAVLILSPIGVWLTTSGIGLFARAQGWELAVRHNAGALVSRARLGYVTLKHGSLGVENEVA